MSVLIIKDFKSSNNELEINLLNIYISVLKSELEKLNIKCESVNFKGFLNEYNLLGKSKENVIYLPKIEITENKVSFLLVDNVGSLSSSFKIASIIQKTRFLKDEDRVLFINKIKDSDALKDCSPLIIDDIRLDEKSTVKQCSFLKNCAVSVASAIVKCYKL